MFREMFITEGINEVKTSDGVVDMIYRDILNDPRGQKSDKEFDDFVKTLGVSAETLIDVQVIIRKDFRELSKFSTVTPLETDEKIGLMGMIVDGASTNSIVADYGVSKEDVKGLQKNFKSTYSKAKKAVAKGLIRSNKLDKETTVDKWGERTYILKTDNPDIYIKATQNQNGSWTVTATETMSNFDTPPSVKNEKLVLDFEKAKAMAQTFKKAYDK